ncbi:hypothetical protein EV44_g3274 [Erysiphe necator]|uniref:Uncharacterized protein n=1 Tax=Uncinula necator TaxID=52586 RepID=A0A0B1PCA4_UNCNE|nr:hypothetical protein EV44_g3274 [Erysiphe necator]
MMRARGLLNIVGPYLEEIETEFPGAGIEFLALITDGVSRAIRGEKILVKITDDPHKIVMIRLGKGHEARNTDSFLLRQQIQKLIPDPTLVSNTWQAPSGIKTLAPTPAKAAAILQYKDVIARRFSNATVERQELWAIFIVGPFPKLFTTLDGKQDPVNELPLQEPSLASLRDEVPIRQVAWKNRSKESTESTGHIRIHIPIYKVHKFPL